MSRDEEAASAAQLEDLGDAELEDLLARLVTEMSRRRHTDNLPADDARRADVRGQTERSIPYAGRVFGAEEVVAAASSLLEFGLTLGKQGKEFERELARAIGVRSSILANSGSSANLLAVSAITSPLVDDHRRLRPGDEVVTCASGFPTTVAPIVQVGATAVLVDADPVTGNIDAEAAEAAVTPRTRAIMVAHSLGNPFDVESILRICRAHGLWLIEDNCDALGSTYTLNAAAAIELLPARSRRASAEPAMGEVQRWTGAWGDLSTQSFYPPHHITMGEGGAVSVVSEIRFRRILESFRDWGRDCWCPSGEDDTCGRRFDWQLGDLPYGYDHKYTYSHLGYNLKPLDIQPAIGRVQLKRLEGFSSARRRNWELLRSGLDDLQDWYQFALPTHATSWTPTGLAWDATGNRTDPSWFGFMLRVRDDAPFDAVELSRHLDRNRIGNRRLFGGNLIRQPVFHRLMAEQPRAVRAAGPLDGADELMNSAVFVGTYPGLTESMLERMIEVLHTRPTR